MPLDVIIAERGRDGVEEGYRPQLGCVETAIYFLIVLAGIETARLIGFHGAILHKVFAVLAGLSVTILLNQVLVYLTYGQDIPVCECGKIHTYRNISTEIAVDTPNAKAFACEECGRRYLKIRPYYFMLDDEHCPVPYKKYSFWRGWIRDSRKRERK